MNIWDLETDMCTRTFEGHADAVMAVTADCLTMQAFSASADITLWFWHLATGVCTWVCEGHSDEVAAVADSGGARTAMGDPSDFTFKRSGSFCCPHEHTLADWRRDVGEKYLQRCISKLVLPVSSAQS